MFPKVAPDFFKKRAEGPVVFKPEAEAPAAAPAAKGTGQAEKYNVNVNGTNYAVVVSPAGTVAATPVGAPAVAPEAAAAPSGGSTSGASVTIPAPMAGQVLRYIASEGAECKKDEVLLILEAMKMELQIKATASGKVHFMAAVGAQVVSQQPLVQIG